MSQRQGTAVGSHYGGAPSMQRGLLLAFLFVVFLLCVDLPQGLLVDVAGDDAVDGVHGGEHAVVLVVVFVHAVAADQEEVVDGVGEVLELVEAGVGAEVGGIGFGDADDVGVGDVGGFEDADLGDL